MRMTILALVLLLVYVTVNYILKCLEYKDLRDLFDNRGKSIKMLNDEVESLKYQYECKRISSVIYHENMFYFRNKYYSRRAKIIELRDEVNQLKHKVYLLRKDTKRNQRAIVRYKEQNAKFKHTDEQSRRLEDLRDRYLTERDVARWYIKAYGLTRKERDAYLYCLRQIQEEVTNAKEE